MKFKKIKYFPQYEISDTGRVYSSHINKFLKQYNSSGLQIVALHNKDKKTCRCVHRLVAEAFISRKSKCYCVKHRDGNRKNNHVDNLYWAEKKHYKPTFIGKTSKILLKGEVR